jgi:hypothetical protein
MSAGWPGQTAPVPGGCRCKIFLIGKQVVELAAIGGKIMPQIEHGLKNFVPAQCPADANQPACLL